MVNPMVMNILHLFKLIFPRFSAFLYGAKNEAMSSESIFLVDYDQVLITFRNVNNDEEKPAA